jgi:hypothetical protein
MGVVEIVASATVGGSAVVGGGGCTGDARCVARNNMVGGHTVGELFSNAMN